MVQDRSGCSQARLYPRIGTHHYTVTQCRADSTGTYHYLCYYVHLILQWPAVTIVQTVQGLYIICVLCIPFVTVFSWYCSGLQSPVQTVQGLTNHSPQLWYQYYYIYQLVQWYCSHTFYTVISRSYFLYSDITVVLSKQWYHNLTIYTWMLQSYSGWSDIIVILLIQSYHSHTLYRVLSQSYSLNSDTTIILSI